jgi:hypothetical protein
VKKVRTDIRELRATTESLRDWRVRAAIRRGFMPRDTEKLRTKPLDSELIAARMIADGIAKS